MARGGHELHLRSALFVPAHRADLLAKARRSGADAVVLDLEDAVPADAKELARATVRAAVQGPAGEPALCVRTAPVGAPDFTADLAAAVGPALLAVMVPKVSGAADVRDVADRLDRLGEPAAGVRIWPLIESARAVLDSGLVAAASPRVAYLGGGTSRGGDLAASLGYRWTAGGLETLHLRSHVLLQARAHGVRYPMTGVVTALEDPDAVWTFAEQSRDLGYDGMLVIHPAHVPVANAVFGSSPVERAEAEAVLIALDAARDGAGVSAGHLVDAAMRAVALQTLARRASPERRSTSD